MTHRIPDFVRTCLPGGAPAPTVLEIDLSRGLLDGPPPDPLAAVRSMQMPVLADVVAGLARGSTDDGVAGAVLLIGGAVTLAQADEIGAALESFAETGKQTIAWSESYGELGPGTLLYYLATRCREVWMQPSGAVVVNGVALEITLLRGLLDKLGAEPHIGQRQEYKSAAETFMSTEVSEPNRQMMQRIGDSVMETARATIARTRTLSAQDVTEAVEASPLGAAEAVRRQLVDRLAYRGELYSHLDDTLGRNGEVRLVYAHRYARRQAARPAEQLSARRKPVVAVVSVRGGIRSGHSGSGGPGSGPSAGSSSVVAALESAAQDDRVQAVVLRVDSPGGSYVASDAIRAAVHAVRTSGKPVVASMGAYAASGGYFCSMPAERIVALPGTLTGSIGVLGGKVVLNGTYDKLGVTREIIESGAHAGMFSTGREFDPAEWARVNAWLDDVYTDFTRKAALDRGMSTEELEPLARGRVWTGADALSRGLVDELGGLQAAIDSACTLAGVRRESVRVARYPHLSPWDRLRPAESSQSPHTGGATWTYSTGGLLSVLCGFDAQGPGVLSLPWRLRFA